MISNLKLLLILALLSFFLFPIFTLKVGASNDDMAALSVIRAEEALASAYEAVLEAEQAGANVSELLDRLNVAGEHFAEANMLYRLGDFDGAVHSADIARPPAEEVRRSAEELKIDAYESWIASLLIRITGSIVGVIAAVIVIFIGWRIFKRRYLRQVQK